VTISISHRKYSWITGTYRLIQAFITILNNIIHKTNSIEPAEITVVVIASHLVLSKIIPIIPNIKDTGTENKMASPPRTPIGSPQPGWIKNNTKTNKPAASNMKSDNIPNRILIDPLIYENRIPIIQFCHLDGGVLKYLV
jgi:hypothetical protein